MKTKMTQKLPQLSLNIIAALLGVAVAGSAMAQQTNPKPSAKPAVSAAEQKNDMRTNVDATAPLKIGFVNTEKILRDSAPAIEAQGKIEAEFKKRDADLQKLANNLRSKYEQFDKNAPVMTDAQRLKAQRELTDMDTDLQRKRREFQEDFNRRRNEAFAGIVDKANQAIRDIAEKGGYDLIVQDAVTVSKRIDITDQVLKALDTKK